MKRLFLIALLLAACTKEDCTEQVSHFTRQAGSDVYLLVETYPGSEKPEDYTDGDTEHIFVLETLCE